MTVTMNAIQVQLKTLASAQNNQESPKMKHYCWSCRIKYTNRSKNLSAKKPVHQEKAYYKKKGWVPDKEDVDDGKRR